MVGSLTGRVEGCLPSRAVGYLPGRVAVHQLVLAVECLHVRAGGYQRARAGGCPQAPAVDFPPVLVGDCRRVLVGGCQLVPAGVYQQSRAAECLLAQHPIEAIFPLGLSSFGNLRREDYTRRPNSSGPICPRCAGRSEGFSTVLHVINGCTASTTFCSAVRSARRGCSSLA